MVAFLCVNIGVLAVSSVLSSTAIAAGGHATEDDITAARHIFDSVGTTIQGMLQFLTENGIINGSGTAPQMCGLRNTTGMGTSAGGTAGTTADVYPVVVMGQDAWGQVALKGMSAIDPTYLPAKTKSHANPLGQYGYVGATFWKTAVRLNETWMTRIETACTGL